MKALKVTISGNYRNRKKEVVDFDNVVGLIPVVDEDKAAQCVQNRYAKIWIGKAVDAKGKKSYPETVDDIRQCFIDQIEEVDMEGDFSFVGKDVRELTFEEIQDLATCKDLFLVSSDRDIADIRQARLKAYSAYSQLTGRGEVKFDDAVKINDLQPLIVTDGRPRRDLSEKLTNDEVLDIEAKNTNADPRIKTSLTYNELLELAKGKNIPVQTGISFDELYAKIYGSVAA